MRSCGHRWFVRFSHSMGGPNRIAAMTRTATKNRHGHARPTGLGTSSLRPAGHGGCQCGDPESGPAHQRKRISHIGRAPAPTMKPHPISTQGRRCSAPTRRSPATPAQHRCGNAEEHLFPLDALQPDNQCLAQPARGTDRISTNASRCTSLTPSKSSPFVSRSDHMRRWKRAKASPCRPPRRRT